MANDPSELTKDEANSAHRVPVSAIRLSAGFTRALQIAPDGIATVFRDRKRTWRESADRVARLSTALTGLGVRRGEPVAVLSTNSDRYFEILHALVRMGGVANPLNTRFAYPELAYCVKDSGSRLLFYQAEFRDTALALARECPSLLHVVPLDEKTPGDLWDYESLLASASPSPDVQMAAEEPAMICYTGGTTGQSKGVVLSAANVYYSVISMLGTGLGHDGAAALHFSPMFHVTGSVSAFIWTFLGGRHVFVPKFEPGEILELIEQHRPPTLIVAPTMLQMLLEHPRFAEFDLSSLRMLIYGMSPMPEALLRRAMELLPNAGFLQAYGQTETTGAITFLQPRDHVLEGPASRRLRSAGRAHPMAEVMIADDRGGEAPRGEPGEICVRSPLVMKGYLNKPDIEAAALRDGWLHTGDIGRLDEDGYLYVVDRVKDMIISGGENVYSSEVENALASHPAVRMCAVIGLPDARWGERVHAVVRLHSGATASAEDLISHCRALIAGYKCPRSVDIWSEDLPVTPVGKIAKAELRKRLREPGNVKH